MFFDSHCHLTDTRFTTDVDAVLDRAAEAGLAGVVTIASNADDARVALQIAGRRAGVWATTGVHPHQAAAPASLDELREIATHPRCVALGEMGLDFHYDTAPRNTQRRVFDSQLGLAADLGMPVVVHSRSADADMAAAIRTAAGVRGVLHCYTGGADLLDAALAGGWYISFTGLVTFRNFEGAAQVRAVPAGRLMVETDSPYLAPVPYRGHRNEPAYVVRVAEALAAIRGVGVAVLAEQTTRAARAFYGLGDGEVLGVSSH